MAGREALLAEAVAAYEATPEHKIEILVEPGHNACGKAWIAGAKRASDFDYLHFGADDLIPRPGWLAAAIECVDAGFIPVPLVWLPGEILQSAGIQGLDTFTGPYVDWQEVEHTTVPFMSAEQWDAIGMIELHYCTDLWVSEIGRRRGWPARIRTGYQFLHYHSHIGRGDQHAQTREDREVFLRLVAEWAEREAKA